MNSVGVIPLPFLNNSEHYKALTAFGNAKQIFAQFLVKESLKKKTALYFRPFKPLLDHTVRLSNIQTAIDKDRIAEAEAQSFELINLSLEGLNYYQKCA
jgi:phosphatidylinositol glycan class N